MILYEEYKYGHRHNREHLNKTFWLGWVPVGVALLMIYAKGLGVGAGMWGGLGFAIAFQMVLWSGVAIHRPRQKLLPITRRLVENTDRWFPQFLIIVQGGFTGVTILLVWFALSEIGVRTVAIQNIVLLLVVVLLPLRRIASIALKLNDTARNKIRFDLIHYSEIIFITLFIALTLHVAVTPKGKTFSTELPIISIIVWITACLVIVSCVILFIDHVLRKQPGLTRMPPSPRSGGSPESF